MKAVILAGGAGTRLRPLTFRRPKPMLPVANRPIMEHIIRLLGRHGFRDIAATLQYMPDSIRGFFRDGSEPLGTAGGVKCFQRELDETFVVISGDALTDFDLTRLIDFHHRKGAMVTMALRRVEDPRQFGVVELDGRGRVVRFLEKPTQEQAFSNLVNTGIYVIQREVLDLVPPGQFFDFSRNLFPLLLERGEGLFGCEMSGYWCDIGTPQAYIQANHDAAAGEVVVEIPGHRTDEGIWVGSGAIIEPGVYIDGPAVIGDHTVIGSGSRIGAMSVIGRGCAIGSRAVLQKAVLWSGMFVGAGTRVSGLLAHDAEPVHLVHGADDKVRIDLDRTEPAYLVTQNRHKVVGLW